MATRDTGVEHTERMFWVPGISCCHCRGAIADAVSQVDGVAGVEVDLDAKTVIVSGQVDDAAVLAAIGGAGYEGGAT